MIVLVPVSIIGIAVASDLTGARFKEGTRAAAKIAMCRDAGRDRAWLQKIRPIQGHNHHFHVRLKCPRGARGCTPQRPTVAELSGGGDGCDETLQWWVTDYLEMLRNPPKGPPPPRKRGARDYTMADLPAQCAEVLASD